MGATENVMFDFIAKVDSGASMGQAVAIQESTDRTL